MVAFRQPQRGRADRPGGARDRGRPAPTALRILDTVIEDQPTFAEAWNKRATLYYMMGDYDRSLSISPMCSNSSRAISGR